MTIESPEEKEQMAVIPSDLDGRVAFLGLRQPPYCAKSAPWNERPFLALQPRYLSLAHSERQSGAVRSDHFNLPWLQYQQRPIQGVAGLLA